MFEITEEEATEYCEAEVERQQEILDKLSAEEASIVERQEALKKILYGRFGRSINLEAWGSNVNVVLSQLKDDEGWAIHQNMNGFDRIHWRATIGGLWVHGPKVNNDNTNVRIKKATSMKKKTKYHF